MTKDSKSNKVDKDNKDAKMPKKASKKQSDNLQVKIEELTADLQRVRADFENYVRRADQEKAASRSFGESAAIMKLLPVIDNIERAISHMPDDLKDHPWAIGVSGVLKSLDKSLGDLGLERINSSPGVEFDPEVHDAVQVDEEAEGDREVIAEELRAGYKLNGKPIRHAMVKVTRK